MDQKRDHKSLLRAALLASTVLSFAAQAHAEPPATSLPAGGRVIGGSASIAQSGAALQVTQSTANAALNWQSFSVGSAAKVSFITPTAQSLTINRVVGPDPSVIAGQVSSNGRLVLVNQSGITVAGGAKIDAQSLVLSAPGITEANARAGKLVFDQPARPDAMVTNAGTLTVAKTGLAALVAPAVANSGVIRAPMGRVVLAGAEAHVVDLYGDGLLSIDVTRQVTSLPAGADGLKVAALVTNTGTIRASGGSVILTASAVEGLVANLVNAGGKISASSANASGTVVIRASGGDIVVAPTARISAKGGTVHVIATGTTTQQGRISARGGSVEVSGSKLVLAGPIIAAHILLDPTDVIVGSVLGGAASGSTLLTPAALRAMSGEVTISATGSLSVNAALDFTSGSAVRGLALLAGNDVNVNAAISLADTGNRLTIVSQSGSVFLGAPVNVGLSGVLDVSAAASVFQTNGAITAGTLTSSGGLGGSLILQQQHNQIASLGRLSLPNGRFALSDDLALTQTGDLVASNAVLFDRASGTAVTLNKLVNISGALALSAGSGVSAAALADQPAIRIGAGATIQAGSLALYSTNRDITNAVAQDAGGVIRGQGAGGVAISGNIYAGNVILGGTLNAVSELAGFNLFAGDLSLTSAQALTVSGPLTSANARLVVVPPGGNGSILAIGITGDVTVAGTLALFANGNIVRSSGNFTVGTITGHALHLVDLGHKTFIQTLGDFAIDGSVLLIDNAAPLLIKGEVRSEFFNINATGSLVLAGNIVTLGVGRVQSTGAIDTNIGSTLSVAADSNGAAVFQQVGISTISSSNGTIATVRISLPSVGGSIILNDLVAPSTDLVVFNPAGTLTGSANIGGLVVVGRGSGTDLSGSVGTIGASSTGATTTTSLSSPESLYRANACTIGAVNCLLGPVNQPVPLTPGATMPSAAVAPGEIEIMLPRPDRRAANAPAI
jgi:filamentous hemagglutinin family protein